VNHDVAIRIWSRLTLPARYKFILEKFETLDAMDPDDPDSKVEQVSFVIHIPAKMLEDRIMDFHFDSQRLQQDERYLIDRFYGPLTTLVGTNALDRVPEPSNDGFLLVCSSV
jgi:hypothetical protein